MAAWTDTFLPFGMNWYDAVLVLGIVYGIWSGVRNGFSAEVITAVGLVMMVVLAIGFYHHVGAWMQNRTGWDGDLANLVAFVGIAVVVFVITFVTQNVVRRKRKAKVFSAIAENIGGAVAGSLRMAVIATWLTVLLCLVRSDFWHEQIAQNSQYGSWLVDHLPTVAAVVDKQFPETVPFFEELQRRQDPDVEKTELSK